MNAYNLIIGAIQTTSGRFSDYWDFAEWLHQRYKDLPYDHEIVKSHLLKDIKQMTRPLARVDQQSALEYLIAQDLDRASAELDKLPTIGEFNDRLHNTYTLATRLLRNFGFELSAPPPLFVVDHFPEPFHTMDWIGYTANNEDQIRYGIVPGIYLLKSELSPYYSELTVVHELMHIIIEQANSVFVGRGLEEGIAEIVGTLYIGSQIYSSNIAHNIFVHSRLAKHLSQANMLYLDYTRQAFLIYRRFGLKGLTQLMHEGRKTINVVEAQCLSGDLDAISLEKGEWNEELTHLVERLLLGFIPNLTVSPLAAYVSQFVKEGMTVKEVAAATQVDIDDTKNALEEIQNTTFTILLHNEKIDFSALSLLHLASPLRYEVNYERYSTR